MPEPKEARLIDAYRKALDNARRTGKEDALHDVAERGLTRGTDNWTADENGDLIINKRLLFAHLDNLRIEKRHAAEPFDEDQVAQSSPANDVEERDRTRAIANLLQAMQKHDPVAFEVVLLLHVTGEADDYGAAATILNRSGFLNTRGVPYTAGALRQRVRCLRNAFRSEFLYLTDRT
jgi:hypothetical protein